MFYEKINFNQKGERFFSKRILFIFKIIWKCFSKIFLFSTFLSGFNVLLSRWPTLTPSVTLSPLYTSLSPSHTNTHTHSLHNEFSRYFHFIQIFFFLKFFDVTFPCFLFLSLSLPRHRHSCPRKGLGGCWSLTITLEMKISHWRSLSLPSLSLFIIIFFLEAKISLFFLFFSIIFFLLSEELDIDFQGLLFISFQEIFISPSSLPLLFSQLTFIRSYSLSSSFFLSSSLRHPGEGEVCGFPL